MNSILQSVSSVQSLSILSMSQILTLLLIIKYYIIGVVIVYILNIFSAGYQDLEYKGSFKSAIKFPLNFIHVFGMLVGFTVEYVKHNKSSKSSKLQNKDINGK